MTGLLLDCEKSWRQDKRLAIGPASPICVSKTASNTSMMRSAVSMAPCSRSLVECERINAHGNLARLGPTGIDNSWLEHKIGFDRHAICRRRRLAYAKASSVDVRKREGLLCCPSAAEPFGDSACVRSSGGLRRQEGDVAPERQAAIACRKASRPIRS
jgi:hypothetical protein